MSCKGAGMDLSGSAAIVVVKDGADTLGDCLDALMGQGLEDIVVVAATESADDTVAIAEARDVTLIRTQGSTLAADRQIGIDATDAELTFMIDADHIVGPGQLAAMADALGDMDAGQSGLRCSDDAGFMQRAESAFWAVYHNVPVGPRPMFGVAPTVYRRRFLDAFRFAPLMAGGADDTDLAFRVAQDGRFSAGVIGVVIEQRHSATLADYLRKFAWYGRGDYEFIAAHPHRAAAHLYHVAGRYGLIRPLAALMRGRPSVAVYCAVMSAGRMAGIVQGALRRR